MSQLTSSYVLSPTIATTFATDAGNAVPALNILTIAGGTNIGTTGAGSTVTINLDSTITLTGVNATTFDTNVAAAGVTLSGTTLQADGTDANIDLTLTPKNLGTVKVPSLQVTGFTAGTLRSGATGIISSLADGVNGALLIGKTGDVPIWANLTSTGGTIAITNGANTINLESATSWSGGVSSWTGKTTLGGGAADFLAANQGFLVRVTDFATASLPTTIAVGQTVRVAMWGSITAPGILTITQAANQKVYFGGYSTTTGVGGSLANTGYNDCLELLCITANLEFLVISSIGNWTIV